MLKEINIFQSLYFTVSYHPYDDRHEARHEDSEPDVSH